MKASEERKAKRMLLRTGRKPTLRTYEMVCWYFTGMADEEELLAHISKLKKID